MVRQNDRASSEGTIVFVCEHGSAKSVVAAAYFNQIANQRGLKLHAIARGTNPDPQISPAAAKGLADDGLEFVAKPSRLTESDTQKATQIVSFCELPSYAKNRVVS
jgi:arsenate reductase (thioredoxin)